MDKDLDSKNYLITYENIYSYNNYKVIILLLFFILLIIYFLVILKKYN
jgi:hypothetical protein